MMLAVGAIDGPTPEKSELDDFLLSFILGSIGFISLLYVAIKSQEDEE
tara:strand:+ start:2559 stop:2702 length:144 start_codon:yes stop_codon:yes gene_type:complete